METGSDIELLKYMSKRFDLLSGRLDGFQAFPRRYVSGYSVEIYAKA